MVTILPALIPSPSCSHRADASTVMPGGREGAEGTTMLPRS